jgi:hypothetical protein
MLMRVQYTSYQKRLYERAMVWDQDGILFAPMLPFED